MLKVFVSICIVAFALNFFEVVSVTIETRSVTDAADKSLNKIKVIAQVIKGQLAKGQ